MKSELSMLNFINERVDQVVTIDDLKGVLSKIDQTEAKVIKENLPYLTDSVRNELISYQKQKKRRAR